MTGNEIRHMVVFSLRHPRGSQAEQAFLQDGERILSAIATVRVFEVLRQVSPKATYEFGFSMVFEDRAAYEAYNSHPAHQAFVRDRWQTEVAAFQEIDFTVL